MNPQPPQFRAFNRDNFHLIPQLRKLGEQRLREAFIVSAILPFRINSYVIDELIDWDNPDDPILMMTLPSREMLSAEHFDRISSAIASEDRCRIRATAGEIRSSLNPHPGGQMTMNIPSLADGTSLAGIQHKYPNTVLFFPSEGQTCHAYCTFCFRWAQFIGEKNLQFASRAVDQLIAYLKHHPEVTDLLITGGDPMVMTGSILRRYLHALLDGNVPSLRSIRIGTKALTYWPYRFITDPDADETLSSFRLIVEKGIHLSIMAHVNHGRELQTDVAREAVRRIRATGAEIRSQSPLLRSINDTASSWANLWNEQLSLGIIPYYMFITRDTGAEQFFAVPLVEAFKIFRDGIQQVSGLGRTVRGPIMSCTPGKLELLGVETIQGESVFVLRFLQAREPSWTYRPFFASLDPAAVWFDQLKPAFGEPEFFFQRGKKPPDTC